MIRSCAAPNATFYGLPTASPLQNDFESSSAALKRVLVFLNSLNEQVEQQEK